MLKTTGQLKILNEEQNTFEITNMPAPVFLKNLK
jgi:hypothetical protein